MNMDALSPLIDQFTSIDIRSINKPHESTASQTCFERFAFARIILFDQARHTQQKTVVFTHMLCYNLPIHIS